MDHYTVLGVSQKASQEDIRNAYKFLSLTCHPDKLLRDVSTTTPASHNHNLHAASEAAQRRWTEIETAHDVLADEFTRAMYDLDMGYVPDTPAEHQRIARLKRRDAERAVAAMEQTVAHMRAEEEARNGLLIVEARYGNLRVNDAESGRATRAPYIDVSVPLQCMVNDSSLIIAGGRSRFWLEGFYDPSMGSARHLNRLRIRYLFLGMMHEAEYDDEEEVAIPLQEHCIDNGAGGGGVGGGEPGEHPGSIGSGGGHGAFGQADTMEGESMEDAIRRGRASGRFSGRFSSHAYAHHAGSAAALARAKAWRRRVLYASIALTGLGVWVLHRNQYSLQASKEDVARWMAWMMESVKNRLGRASTSASASASSSPSSSSVAARPNTNTTTSSSSRTLTK